MGPSANRRARLSGRTLVVHRVETRHRPCPVWGFDSAGKVSFRETARRELLTLMGANQPSKS